MVIHHDQACAWRFACLFQAYSRQAQELARPAADFGEAPLIGTAPEPEGGGQRSAHEVGYEPDKPEQAIE